MVTIMAFLFIDSAEGASSQKLLKLAAPAKRLTVQIRMPAPGGDALPEWYATFKGRQIMSGALDLQTAGDGSLLAGARLVTEQRADTNERIPVLFGKADHAANQFREMRLEMESAKGRHNAVVFRCYDDAIA
jgi:hypothetical protein